MALAKRSRANALDTKEMLVEQAVDLFYQEGYLQISVDRICEMSPKTLTKGAFYHLFDSKEEILFLIHERYLSLSLNLLARLDHEKLSPREKFSRLFQNTLFIIKTMRKFVVVANREYRYLTGPFRRQATAARRQYRLGVEKIIREGQETGDFSPKLDPKIAALNYLGMVNWMYQWINEEGPHSVDEIVAMSEEQLMSGLRSRR